jgi:hypothetical protein
MNMSWASTFEYIDSYRCFYLTSGYDYEAKINCYKNNKLVGEIRFYKDDFNIPVSNIQDGILKINFPISRFNDVITILRYEKPLYIVVNTQHNFGGVANTSKEPIGEEET